MFKNILKRLKTIYKNLKFIFSNDSDLKILEKAILTQLNKMDDISRRISSNIPRNFYLKEMRTLSIQLPRRMGNTTLAVNISKHFQNYIYIVHSMDRAKTIQREFGIKNVYSYNEVFRGGLKGRSFDLVIMDECGFFNELNEERLYEYFNCIPFIKILKVGQL